MKALNFNHQPVRSTLPAGALRNSLTGLTVLAAGIAIMALPHKSSAQLDTQLINQVKSGTLSVNAHYSMFVSNSILGPVTADGITCLMMPAQKGHAETVKWLLEHGADPNARNAYGVTAFRYSIPDGGAEDNYVKIVKLFLEHGADANAKDNSGWTALLSAAFHGYTEITRLLLKYHADVNGADKYGRSPLMMAAGYGYTNEVKLLLDNGADVDAKDQNGKTALGMVSDSSEIAMLMRAKKTK